MYGNKKMLNVVPEHEDDNGTHHSINYKASPQYISSIQQRGGGKLLSSRERSTKLINQQNRGYAIQNPQHLANVYSSSIPHIKQSNRQNNRGSYGGQGSAQPLIKKASQDKFQGG
jgi:hypothetical protein